jgi:hypothetical protein
MKTKTLAILLTAIIALNIMGFSYAGLSGKIKTNNNSNTLKTYFVLPLTYSDNEMEKDVAQVTATISIEGAEIEIFITNGYPCYEAYVDFTIQNQGDKTVHIYNVTVENLNPTALDVAVTDLTCTTLYPWDETEGTVTTHILQTAQECHTYTFKITIELRDPAVGPGTPGFWKRQFEAQTNPDLLEKCLDQINATSRVFNGSFTGSREEKFATALDILGVPKHSSKEVQLKSQLLALWLNYESGLANGCTIDGLTAIEIIEGSETALTTPSPAEYQYWKNLCDRFNNL